MIDYSRITKKKKIEIIYSYSVIFIKNYYFKLIIFVERMLKMAFFLKD